MRDIDVWFIAGPPIGSKCYESEVYYFMEGDKYLMIDDAKEVVIHARNNPRAEYWNLEQQGAENNLPLRKKLIKIRYRLDAFVELTSRKFSLLLNIKQLS
jgi:hypothetical protein